jgi:protein CpxP
VASDTMDQELVLKHVNAKADAVRDQAPAVVAAVADFYDSLNAEQQAQIRSKVEKKIERMRDRHSK